MSQPSQTDIVSGLDPTGFTNITSAQLETMVGGATPYSDKGIVMVTTDASPGNPNVPAAQTTTKWQTYLWLRIQPSSTSIVLYAWNPNSGSDATFLQWQSVLNASIPSLSIQGYQIAPSTITYDKILNLQLSQIIGYNTLLTTVLNPTAGDISGSYALGFTINNGAVTLSKFDTTGTKGQLLTNSANATPAWLAAGLAGTVLKNSTDNTPTWVTQNQITTGLANPDAGGANDGQVIAVNSGAAGTFKYLTSAQLTAIANTVNNSAGYSFTSSLITLTAAAVSTQAHGLTATPTRVRGVIVCQSAELGYSIGDEVAISTIIVRYAATNPYAFPLGAMMANATNIVFQFNLNFADGIFINRLSATAGTSTALTPGSWKLKIYAKL